MMYKSTQYLFLLCLLLNGIQDIITQNTKKLQSNRGLEHLRSHYNTLNYGQYIYDDQLINTIRHIPSYKVNANNKTYVIFNLGLLNPNNNEKLRKAEFYLNRRQFRQEQKFSLNFHFINAKNSIEEFNSLPAKTPILTFELNTNIPSNVNENEQDNWLSINIDEAINSYFANRLNQNDEILLVIDISIQQQVSRLAAMARQQRIYSILMKYLNPYLLAYSTDSIESRNKFFETRILASRLATVSVDDAKKLNAYQNRVNRLNKKKVLKGKTNLKEGKRLILKRDENSNINSTNDSDLILSSNYSAYSPFIQMEVVEENCGAKPISIDFDDLGLSEWLLEPKRYQSNFCSGSCSFALKKGLNYSNYAILQSILNKVEINEKNVPTKLCCSPSHLTQLTIMYRDTNDRDHVVKVLPDMIVDKCSCR